MQPERMQPDPDRISRERQMEKLGRDEPPSPVAAIPLGLVGAAIGGTIGYFAFFWLAEQGLYAIILPGAFLGLGSGVFSRGKVLLLGVICGLAALVLGVYTEWRFSGSGEDFAQFVAQVHHLRPITIILIVLGAVFAFWFGEGREGGVWRRRHHV